MPRVVRLACLLILLLPASLAAQDSVPPRPKRPVQVTDSAVQRGQELFHGAAGCALCHGVAGVGTDSGPALAQGVWMHGPDSFEGILARILHGVPRTYSTRDVVMPMRGWADMSDHQARDVAAYVWVLSHSFRPVR
jgi:mono/diheme cytochrome c family protein